MDDQEMHTWRSLLAATSRLMATLDTELQAGCDLPLADFEVLVQLSEAPGNRVRMSELADALNLSPSGLTRRVDRLAREHLVQRERCGSDRRGSFAVLTPAGVERLERSAPHHLRHVRQHFIDRFGPAELSGLAGAFERIIDACPRRPSRGGDGGRSGDHDVRNRRGAGTVQPEPTSTEGQPRGNWVHNP